MLIGSTIQDVLTTASTDAAAAAASSSAGMDEGKGEGREIERRKRRGRGERTWRGLSNRAHPSESREYINIYISS